MMQETLARRKHSYLEVKCGQCGKVTICGKIPKLCANCRLSFEGVVEQEESIPSIATEQIDNVLEENDLGLEDWI